MSIWIHRNKIKKINNHQKLGILICKSEIKKLNNHQKSDDLYRNVERDTFTTKRDS
jgi:hypothetical protein